MSDVVVFERRFTDKPGEVWYDARGPGFPNGLNAGWADPEVARRKGEEEVARRAAMRGGATMSETPEQLPTEEPDEDKPESPEQLPERVPGEEGEGHEGEPGRPDDPGKSEDAPGQNKPEPKDDGEDE